MRNVLLALVAGCVSALAVSTLRAEEDDLGAAIRKGMGALAGDGPVGAVVAFAGPRNQVEPGGWLHERGWRLCDGAALARSEYRELFAVIGWAHGGASGDSHFRVPDLRGRFLRGVDHGAHRAPGARARDAEARVRLQPHVDGSGPSGNAGDRVGSLQLDAFQGHKHKDLGHQHNYTFFQAPYRRGDDAHDRNCEDVAGTGKTGMGFARLSDPVESNFGKPRFGRETRPVNVAVNWIIKARPGP